MVMFQVPSCRHEETGVRVAREPLELVTLRMNTASCPTAGRLASPAKVVPVVTTRIPPLVQATVVVAALVVKVMLRLVNDNCATGT